MATTDRDATQAVQTVAPGAEADDSTPASTAPPTQKKPQKELLCTICGLRACWLEPGQ